MADDGFVFRCDYAKTNRSACKKCKAKIDKGALRLARMVTNGFSDEGGLLPNWFHPTCIFETFAKARAATRKIECSEDIEHFGSLKQDDQTMVNDQIEDYLKNRKGGPGPRPKTPAKPKVAPNNAGKSPSVVKTEKFNTASVTVDKRCVVASVSFFTVTKLCDKLRGIPSYLAKSELVRGFLKSEGLDTESLHVVLKLLIPSVDKRVYNLKDKQLVKVLSGVLHESLDDLSEHLEAGDVGETGRVFYQKSTLPKPANSTLTCTQVDAFLEKLTKITREVDQLSQFRSLIPKCTPHDIKYILYLIKKDLRINIREKHILEGLHPQAYSAFRLSQNLKDIADKYRPGSSTSSIKSEAASLQLMQPIKPMLAEACKSIAQAMGKFPEGMYSEIKYDGERVQLHKSGLQFEFYSRSLKPVLPHKVKMFHEYIPLAFPTGDSLILDCEVLLVDLKTGKPLPFGTLGIHKKNAFTSASVCLFVFDILFLNGKSLVDKSIRKRREILSGAIQEIPNRVMLSEVKLVKKPGELGGMISHVLREGLEGLVLKGLYTKYEPGKRHWLKVKKDYLQGGAMADSADLVVLGGFLGTGNKGGMCSVFLMGTYCPLSLTWKTVCKVGNGHDDATLERVSKSLIASSRKVKGDYNTKPAWLDVSRGLMPDFVVTDPKQSPVWEIQGAEFSQSSVHTAAGISIRFPRVTRIRADKDWQTATDLPRLQKLMRTSQENADQAIQKLMLQESGGKMSVPQAVVFDKKRACIAGESSPSKKPRLSTSSPLHARTSVKQETASNDHPTKYPSSPSSKSKTFPSLTSLPSLLSLLPSPFLSLKLYISKRIPERELLSRYLVAYGGDVSTDKEEADYIVVASGTGSERGRVRSKEWFCKMIREAGGMVES